VLRFVSITLLLALAVLACAASRAGATPRDEELFKRPIEDRAVLFGSVEIGRSIFVSGGSKQALIGPLDRPGLLALESSGIGLTRERIRVGDVVVPIQRFVHQGSVLAGYQTMHGPLYVAAYAGPELDHEQVAYEGRFARFSQPRLGARGQAEVWWNPTPDTLLTTTVVVSSARSSLWARASGGIRVWGRAFVGPEIVAYTTPTYRETRYGAHLTGLAVGIVNLRLSGGVMTDDGRRTVSPYAGVSAWIRL
jgi:hypothetical protein